MERRPRRTLTCVSDDIDAITPCPTVPNNSPTEPAGFPGTLERRTSSSSRSSSTSSRSPSPSSAIDEPGSSSSSPAAADRPRSERRRSSIKSLEEGTEGDPSRLWRRMLALQQIYGCYRSARMSAALELGDTCSLMPSKACLDLMNEDIALPDSAEDVLKDTSFRNRLRRKRSQGM